MKVKAKIRAVVEVDLIVYLNVSNNEGYDIDDIEEINDIREVLEFEVKDILT